MKICSTLLTIGFILIALSTAMAENDSGLVVGSIKLSATDWGEQTASIELTNTGEYFKFVTARVDVLFPGALIETSRSGQKMFIIQPPDKQKLEIPFIVPGNLGHGQVTVSLYDVVDTLDPQKKIPASLESLINPGIQLPSFVDQTRTFDNQFSRILILLLHRGESLQKIAKISGVKVSFALSLARYLERDGFLYKDNGVFYPAFRVIDNDDIEKLMPLIDRTVNSMYELMALNLPLYDETLERLTAEGRLTGDRSNLLDPGSVLYHHYPSILGLFLWNHLGRVFIKGGDDFGPFINSDPCQGIDNNYMYMVSGPPDNIGRGFYYNVTGPNMDGFYFGAETVKLNCTGRGMVFEELRAPIYYTYNELIAAPAMKVLSEGISGYLDKLEAGLHDVFGKEGDQGYIKGARLWSWSLVVDHLVEKLEKNNIIEKEGTGLFVMQKTDE
jgi:hypothetical protein